MVNANEEQNGADDVPHVPLLSGAGGSGDVPLSSWKWEIETRTQWSTPARCGGGGGVPRLSYGVREFGKRDDAEVEVVRASLANMSCGETGSVEQSEVEIPEIFVEGI